MKKTSTNKADQDIPVLKREQLGKGARGKYFQQYAEIRAGEQKWQTLNKLARKP